MIRIAIADDQKLVRLGLRTLIDGEPDLELVGEASDGRQALELLRSVHPDLLLLDIRMPEMDGLEALREITASPQTSATKVIVLTTFELDDYVFEALQAGASGFLVKDAEPQELLHAVRVVARGDSLLSPTVTRRVIGEFVSRRFQRATPHKLLGTLTEREREMVAWVATGLSNDEIAEKLFISSATVRTHVSRAMVKLQARDRAQLVVFAFQSGIALAEGQEPPLP